MKPTRQLAPVQRTRYHADAVACLDHSSSDAKWMVACANYELNEETRQRMGCIYLYSVEQKEQSKEEQVELCV